MNSIAALKALGAGVVPCLTVLGYHAAGDGGGGTFYWDDLAFEAGNAGTVITPASNPPIGRWKRLMDGPLSVKWFGAHGNGVANDRASIQDAINASAAINRGLIEVVFPFGNYLVCGGALETPLVATQLVLRGAEEFAPCSAPGSRIWCNGVEGALLGYNSNLDGISIISLDIDGSNGAPGTVQGSGCTRAVSGPPIGSFSTTWTGLFTAPPSGCSSNFIRVSGCHIHHTAVQSAKAIDLTNTVFSLVENCLIQQFVNGYAIYLAGSDLTTTTATLRKLYLQYNLECVYIGSVVSDCHIYDTVFESSLVALSAVDSQVSLNGCYFENIGYVYPGASQVALTMQDMGYPTSSGVPVNTAMNFRFGTVEFCSCLFAYLGSSGLAVAWVRGVGITYPGGGALGSATFDGCRRTSTNDVFIALATEGDCGYTFRVFDPSDLNSGGPIGIIQSYADARAVAHGRILLVFGELFVPGGVRPAKVQNGLFVYGVAPDNNYTGPLTEAPVGGQNIVGDCVLNSVAAPGGYMGWVCVAAGNPGTWKAYAPIAT